MIIESETLCKNFENIKIDMNITTAFWEITNYTCVCIVLCTIRTEPGRFCMVFGKALFLYSKNLSGINSITHTLTVSWIYHMFFSRYQPTVQKKPWRGVKDTLEYGPACLQNSSVTSTPQYVISEDCLQLNVFVHPQCSSRRPCAVLHFIHGGANYFDSPRQFPVDTQVDNFVSKGIIMVSVSYRYGTFAFWNTRSDVAIGNYGMYGK